MELRTQNWFLSEIARKAYSLTEHTGRFRYKTNRQ